MMRSKIWFILLLFSGCRQGEMILPEYVGWVRNPSNGLRIEKEVSGITYLLQYKPAEWMAAAAGSISSEHEFRNLVKEYKHDHYLDLLISAPHPGEMEARVKSETGEMPSSQIHSLAAMNVQDDFILVSGSDTIRSGLIHLERPTGIVSEWRIALAFEKPDSEFPEDIELIYMDELLGTGPVKFHINKGSLESIPNLKL